jgi:hypothetical protein
MGQKRFFDLERRLEYKLFARFGQHLEAYIACGGQIIDATIVSVTKQRYGRLEHWGRPWSILTTRCYATERKALSFVNSVSDEWNRSTRQFGPRPLGIDPGWPWSFPRPRYWPGAPERRTGSRSCRIIALHTGLLKIVLLCPRNRTGHAVRSTQHGSADTRARPGVFQCHARLFSPTS